MPVVTRPRVRLVGLLAASCLPACAGDRAPGVDCEWVEVSQNGFESGGDLAMFDSGEGVAVVTHYAGPVDDTLWQYTLVTDDAGVTWTKTFEFVENDEVTLHAFDQANLLLGGEGLRRSTDGGRSWTWSHEPDELHCAQVHFWMPTSVWRWVSAWIAARMAARRGLRHSRWTRCPPA